MKTKRSMICAMTLVCMLAVGCTGGEENRIVVEAPEVEANEYTTTFVQKGTVSSTEEVLIVNKQGGEQTLAFYVDGKIMHIHAVKGDLVKKGQVLAEVEMDNVPEQIADLEDALETDQLLQKQLNEQLDVDLKTADNLYNYEYIDANYKQKINQEKDRIRSMYQPSIEACEDRIYTTTNRLNEKKELLSYGTIVAPFDGIITQCNNGLDGGVSQIDRTIMSIADTAETIYVSTDAKYKDCFQEGVVATARMGMGEDRIEFQVMPQDVDKWENSMTFVAYGDTSQVKEGWNAYVIIPIAEKKNVLNVLNGAVHSAKDFHYVYVQDENGQREMVEVQIGLVGNDTTEIISGLKEGQEVIVK